MYNGLIDEWLSRLKQSGYRLTRSCRAIIETIVSSSRALDATTIFDLVRKSNPDMGLVTVYRTLQKLEDLELVQRVHYLDGCHRFLPAAHGHQHLLICTRCGNYVMFSGDNLDSLISRVRQDSGYQISNHWLQFFGLCPQCQFEMNTLPTLEN